MAFAIALGTLIKYHPLIMGFITGLSLLIFSTQIKDFFGLKMGNPSVDFVDKWISYFQAFLSFDPLTLGVPRELSARASSSGAPCMFSLDTF